MGIIADMLLYSFTNVNPIAKAPCAGITTGEVQLTQSLRIISKLCEAGEDIKVKIKRLRN
jgi:hypothetical protein